MTAEFNAKKYLSRIGVYDGDIIPDLAGLNLLQRQHLLTVPFENLDIHWKRPIVVDTDSFYRKIVENNRGGFCYEQNGLFNVLLKEIGFDSRMISARVSSAPERFGAEYDHMAIIVALDGQEYIADVGFGAFTAEPLRFVLDFEQRDKNGIFRVRKYDGDYFLIEKKNEDGWTPEYIFTTGARELAEFAGMCEFHQTSPESHFTKKIVCSLMTEVGRKTLSGDKFIETEDGERTEIAIGSQEQFNEILEREFGIEPKTTYDRLHFLQ